MKMTYPFPRRIVNILVISCLFCLAVLLLFIWWNKESLHDAAESGNIDVVRTLVSQGANVNAKDKDGRTPLYWAACNRNVEVIQFLVSQGANVNAIGVSILKLEVDTIYNH